MFGFIRKAMRSAKNVLNELGDVGAWPLSDSDDDKNEAPVITIGRDTEDYSEVPYAITIESLLEKPHSSHKKHKNDSNDTGDKKFTPPATNFNRPPFIGKEEFRRLNKLTIQAVPSQECYR